MLAPRTLGASPASRRTNDKMTTAVPILERGLTAVALNDYLNDYCQEQNAPREPRGDEGGLTACLVLACRESSVE